MIYDGLMSIDSFWTNVDKCLDEIEKARTSDAVIATLNEYFSVSAGDAFFGGSGGDRTLWDSLEKAGWSIVWAEAVYFYMAKNQSGEILTYIEGDVYRGDRR